MFEPAGTVKLAWLLAPSSPPPIPTAPPPPVWKSVLPDRIPDEHAP